jgi:hypothetical protein
MAAAADRKVNLHKLVSNIIYNGSVRENLRRVGLEATGITWEDTGRSHGSCFGPNISDMTLIVKEKSTLMPVIRTPNFTDVTYDVPLSHFKLKVGNESAEAKSKTIPLQEYLTNLNKYCPDAKEDINLFAEEKDVNVLCSTQCCVLPVASKGETEFGVQLFNYQSYDDNPAVLVILISKDGTSTQIIEKKTQRLLFNDKGIGKYFKIERLADQRARLDPTQKAKIDSFTEMTIEEKTANVIMMIQVPLVCKPNPKRGEKLDEIFGAGFMPCSCVVADCYSDGRESRSRGAAGFDRGQVSVGSGTERFVGTKGLRLERDKRFPIRCTYQIYTVTDEDNIGVKDILDIAKQMDMVKKVAVDSGSLVTDADTLRTTKPDLMHPKPSDDPFGKLGDRDYLPF